ncbi:unnamed protein product [Camellia sinensis]
MIRSIDTFPFTPRLCNKMKTEIFCGYRLLADFQSSFAFNHRSIRWGFGATSIVVDSMTRLLDVSSDNPELRNDCLLMYI